MNEYWDEQKAFSLDGGKYYFAIQTCDDGYDYTIYNEDYSDYDGGQLDEPDMSIDAAVECILEEHGLNDLSREPYDYDELIVQSDTVQQARIAQARAGIKQPLSEQIREAEGKRGSVLANIPGFETHER